jgi:rhodanese-related sulfurtransferase/SHS2 domain-containing protein
VTTRPDRIEPEVLQEYLEAGQAHVVDARPEPERLRSDEQIPQALPIDPGSGARMDRALLALPREKLLVAYCDEPGHAASAQVARRARELGRGDASVLEGGLRAWKAAGLPTEFIDDGRGSNRSRHRVELTDHTVRVTARAPSLPELLAETARALAVVLGLPGPEGEATAERLELQAEDRSALLATWLNALVARADRQGRLYPDPKITRASDIELAADLRGHSFAGRRERPTAVEETSVSEAPGGLEAVFELPRI